MVRWGSRKYNIEVTTTHKNCHAFWLVKSGHVIGYNQSDLFIFLRIDYASFTWRKLQNIRIVSNFPQLHCGTLELFLFSTIVLKNSRNFSIFTTVALERVRNFSIFHCCIIEHYKLFYFYLNCLVEHLTLIYFYHSCIGEC